MKNKFKRSALISLLFLPLSLQAEDPHAAHKQAGASSTMSDMSNSDTNMSNMNMSDMNKSDMAISAKQIHLKGVDVTRAVERELSHKIRFNSTVGIDETKVTHVQAKMMGWIEDLQVAYVGQAVKKGQPLFSIYSQDLISAQEEYLLALENVKQPVPGSLAKEAQIATQDMLQSSKRKLELLDIPAHEIKRIESAGHSLRALTILAPANGVVLSKTATKGMNVMPGMDLYVIADLSTLWVGVDVYESDLDVVSLGADAIFYGNDSAGHIMKAKVAFISPVVDEKSRTIKTRIEVDNRDGHMKPGMYGTVEIAKSFGSRLAVPKSAVIDTGQRKIVFVQVAPDVYSARELSIGHRAGDWIEVRDGLHAGENVAVSGQFLLDADTTIQSGGMEGMGHQHGSGEKQP
ncbi:MAG TPA: efflux RND transporter periplasmic adaptor subunit [Pseudomonadales bacterium]|nr:efflux RND transporter periplasmic adaptor subunit [Pseudomonadales bacterium]